MKTQEWTTGEITLDEMIKLLSIIENPDGAANVRKALRFYEAPEMTDWKVTPLVDFMPALKRYDCPYSKEELEPMLDLVKGAKAVLVVGAGFGGVLKRMAALMPKGSTLVAVENPDSDVPAYLNRTASLKETCRQLCVLGAKVELFLGDSHADKLVRAVEAFAPYDFIFMNGDQLDADNYGPMGYVMGRASGSGIGIVYRE